jgi:hypothetical protein
MNRSDQMNTETQRQWDEWCSRDGLLLVCALAVGVREDNAGFKVLVNCCGQTRDDLRRNLSNALAALEAGRVVDC